MCVFHLPPRTNWPRYPQTLLAAILPAIWCDASLRQETDNPAAGIRPNVLFIAVDDLRPSLGCYGDTVAVTPSIDSLATRSLRFDNAHCQVAVCNPSRASLMTGLRPDTLGVWTLPIHFREAKPDAITLPQWLRQNGYTAVSHGKIFHNPTPDPQSWSEPIASLPTVQQGYPDDWRRQVRETQAELPEEDWRKNNLRGPSTAAPEIDDNLLIDGARTEMAIRDLKRLSQDGPPFFLAIGYIRPHLAWIAPKTYWDMYRPADLPVLQDTFVTPETPRYALSNSYELTHYVDLIDFPEPWDARRLEEEKARHLMHAYYACISYVDAQIGRLLQALQDCGESDNTIIVLWSDHGWKLGEHNGWGKMSNYEIDTRVPLLLSAPGMATSGQGTAAPVELLDLFPTLCELTGTPIPEFVEGSSLAPLLQDASAAPDKAAFSQYYRRHEDHEYMGYAMRTSDWRLIEWRDFATGTVAARELYDHRSDNAETTNVIEAVGDDLRRGLIDELHRMQPPRPLQMVPSVHSNPNRGRLPSPLVFNNESETPIHVYPITPQGRRGKRQVIAAGSTRTLNARIGGVFVVESTDGRIHEIHSPAWPSRPIIIRSPSDDHH